MNSKIRCEQVTKSFGLRESADGLLAVDGISFEVRPEEVLCIVGPSGCGKSTLLNMIAGFVSPDAGVLLMNDSIIRRPSPERTMVFQEQALFPWKTARGNIAFGLRCRGEDAEVIERKVGELLGKMHLDAFADHYPHELSGGMRQKVALARAFALEPEVILMDEPFAALDRQARDSLQEELLRMQTEHGQTVIFVTHDIEEALFLGDRILVLTQRPARVKQLLTVPYDRPRSPEIRNEVPFVALKKRIWQSLREETSFE